MNYVTYNGETKTLRQWSKVAGVPYRILRVRYHRGWELGRAIFQRYTPHRRRDKQKREPTLSTCQNCGYTWKWRKSGKPPVCPLCHLDYETPKPRRFTKRVYCADCYRGFPWQRAFVPCPFCKSKQWSRKPEEDAKCRLEKAAR